MYNPEVRIHINAPPINSFNPLKPTALAFFALPNGNTIEMTVGKKIKAGDDWHFDIQHIGAQTRFIRSKIKDTNFVTIYLEANAASVPLSWPTWRSKYANNAALIKGIVDSVKNIFANYNPYIVLSGHSGGGGFSFSYFNALSAIPNEIKRITFLDSDYNYDNTFGEKIKNWLLASSDHHLSVLAYNDSVALLNGQPVVSPTGGTWYRTRMMVSYLSNYFTFTYEENSTFIKHTALNGRIKIILKQNPTQAILHTTQVELNGFIHTMLSGTPWEENGYSYYGSRAYSSYIQTGITLPKPIQIPPRPAGAMTGSQFISNVAGMTIAQREDAIYNEITKGNIPDFMRVPKKLQSVFQDNDGVSHSVVYEVLPDYLCIGSNENFCRMPMSPVTAQKIANLFGAALPTPKLVDDIYSKSELKLAPIPFAVSDPAKIIPSTFLAHSRAIDSQFVLSGKTLGALIGGTKKDVVISNKIAEKPGNVVIYGWHQLNGSPIQPAYNGHAASYIDYSHGIRLMNLEILVDSITMNVKQILTDAKLYKILSGETAPMTQPSYLSESNAPAVPKSFGIKSESPTSLRIAAKADTNIAEYFVYLSADGVNFPNQTIVSASSPVIVELKTDSLYYVRIKASNSAGASTVSEVLAGVPSSMQEKILIVNGFDRASTGNTFNFIRQHASAIKANGMNFASATNDAVIDGIFNLNNYSAADYILGDESTVDETFSSVEQTKIKSFLQNGGKLFLSGAEIAWDLDYKGTAADKDFINNFLKMKYIADAPNGVSATTYQAEILNRNPFSEIPPLAFDNGTRGTIDVKWPDVVKPSAGGIGFAKYTNLDTASGFSGIYFNGMFPSGTASGKIVAFGFPFETIYSQSAREQLMGKILNFFSVSTIARNDEIIPTHFLLKQNFPNPFNPVTTIVYALSPNPSPLGRGEGVRVTLKIYDMIGREVALLVDEEQTAGNYSIPFDASKLSSGVYLYTLRANSFSATKKMMLVR